MKNKYINVALGKPVVKVWEISKEWLEGRSKDANAVLIDVIETDDLAKGCFLARKKYPNKNLRISKGKTSIEMDENSGEVDIEALKKALKNKV